MQLKYKAIFNPLVLISIVFFFLRLVNLTIIPIFADEAIYIHWAQTAWHDSSLRFISLTDGKPPLHTWLLIPFLKVIKDPLVAARLLSVTAGFASMMGLFLIANKIFNKKIAMIAALLMALCPFLVFYDRLAVADSLLTAFGIWAFYLGINIIEKPDFGKSFLLGCFWGGGLLTKQPALYFIILFPFLFLLHPFKISLTKLLSKMRKGKILLFLIPLLVSILVYNVVKLSPNSHLISVRSYDYILGKREFLKDPFKLFWGNLQSIILWIYSYQTFVGAMLFLTGLICLFKNNWKKALVFLVWLIIPILGSAAIGKIVFPRYFLFIQPWIIIFISYGLVGLYKKTRSLVKTGSLLPWLIYIGALLPWLIFSFLIVFSPVKAPLIKREQDQYLTTWSAGYGIKEAAEYLKTHHQKEKVYVATEGYIGTLPDGLRVYLDGYQNIEVYGVGQPIDKVPATTLTNAQKAPTYLVINDSRYYGTWDKMDLIAKYPKPDFPFLKESLLFFKIKKSQ